MVVLMPFSHPLEQRLAASWPPQAWQDVTTLVAVSGGADSVALLRSMAALKDSGEGRLHAAHFNHHLRGGDSDADAAFVVDLCRRCDVACEVGEIPPGQLGDDCGDGLEAACRTARYEFLRQTAAQLGARYVVTAHTADDQAETVLHRILRGTGIGGLAGMRRARPLGEAATLIRPMLDIRREELLAYLDALGQPYCRDVTNEDLRFTRNRIRRELLPLLGRQFNSGVVEALLRLGTLAGEVQAVVDARVAALVERYAVVERGGVVKIAAGVLAEEEVSNYMIRELLMAVWRTQGWPMQAMGFEQWDQLASMLAEGGTPDLRPASPRPTNSKQTFPGNITAEIGAGWLRIG